MQITQLFSTKSIFAAMRYGNLIFRIALVLVNLRLSAASQSHPITTLINAKWSVTPVQLEIAEYLSDVSNQKFWLYVNELANIKLEDLSNDQERYNMAMEVAGGLLSKAQLKLMKLSLSLKSLTPRVQSNLMIADEILHKGDCGAGSKAFVIHSGEIICSVKELNKRLNDDVKGVNSDLYNFDHIYPGTENHEIVTILYGEFGSGAFNKFHAILKKQPNIKYIVRHYVSDRSTSKVRLSGYGVELHLKSTEYKAQDDSPRKDKDEMVFTDSVESEVEGFNFAVLKERYPHLSHSLERLRGSLVEKNEEIAPLKAWEFQELGLQAAERVASIQGEEALTILQLTAQNFPTQAKTLVHTPVSEAFKEEMKNNIDVLARNLNLQPPDSALFVNGLYYDAESVDAESLLDVLKKESTILEGLNSIGIQGEALTPLLGLDFASNSKEFAIDIRDTSIIWTNDLETDKEYKRWGASVMDMLRPTFPGMMRSVRKNFFNLVLVFDPVKPDVRDLLTMADNFVSNMAPIRLGIVFDSRAGKGKLNELYQTLNCAFNYLHQKKGAREALSFLLDVYASTGKKDDVEIENLKNIFKKTTSLSQDDVDYALGDDSDFDYGRQISDEFIERLGVKQLPQALLNGVLLADKQLNRDDFEELILTEIMSQTPGVQKAIYRGDLSDAENVVDWLMSQPHVMLR